MAMDGSNVEELAIGCLLSIKTTLGDEFHGQVITFDRPSNILVLQDGLKPGSCRNIRILKANYIKEFSYLGQGEDTLDLKKCYLDLNSPRAREELAIRQAEAEAERIGVGVTSEAHSIMVQETILYLLIVDLLLLRGYLVKTAFGTVFCIYSLRSCKSTNSH